MQNRQLVQFRDSLTRRGRGSNFARMSGLPFELLLALRYLRPKRTFVSVITLISVLGVTLGVAVLIIVISVMSGFDAQLRDKILGFNTHIKVMPRYETMTNYAAIARTVTSNRNVKAVAPFVMGPVLLETKAGSSQSRVGAPCRLASPACLGCRLNYCWRCGTCGPRGLSSRSSL